MQTWTSEEIKQILQYVAELQHQNEELQAKMIAMDAYVKNADAKIKYLNNILNTITNGSERN